jgi:hypothetical protein
MLSIEKCSVPAQSFLSKYSLDGSYADCYRTEVQGQIPLSEFVFSFYTTTLFKVEAFILARIVKRPSDDGQARQLADGTRNEFAAWKVESRKENELLMCDMSSRTRSWFMVQHLDSHTQLYFGSAVVPKKDKTTGKTSLGFIFTALLGFHKIYSVLLLYFAKRSVIGKIS